MPAISETIAFSSWASALSKEDFPAFGFPAIATGTPCFMALPTLNESIRDLIVSCACCKSFSSSSRSAKFRSSSLKSSSSSTMDAKFTSCSLNCSNLLKIPPRSCCIATRCAASPSLAMRSATASACVKSIFPLIKALNVNSPGSASCAPLSTSS